MPELLNSLPINGLDGTMRRSRATPGRAHLKTGSLRDVVGLAGNTRLLPEAPAWGFKSDAMKWDTGYLTGLVCHGKEPFGTPSVYGPMPAAAQLLDGVLLAAKCSALLDAGVRFDEQFDFHFYDLDFTRQANAKGLKVGTWPIGVTHVSGGAFGSAPWKKARELYRKKWSEAAL